MSDIESKLNTIIEKLETADVLNGGFIRLEERMKRIDEINNSQMEQITEISSKLYDPEKGLIVKINDIGKTVDELQNRTNNLSAMTLEAKPVVEFFKKGRKFYWLAIGSLVFPLIVELLKHLFSK